MTARELIRILKRCGCTVQSGKGGHMKVTCGGCKSVVPVHADDIRVGTLHSIIKQLEPCLGKDWHKEK